MKAVVHYLEMVDPAAVKVACGRWASLWFPAANRPVQLRTDAVEGLRWLGGVKATYACSRHFVSITEEVVAWPSANSEKCWGEREARA
jgi:hypothetical protein